MSPFIVKPFHLCLPRCSIRDVEDTEQSQMLLDWHLWTEVAGLTVLSHVWQGTSGHRSKQWPKHYGY